MNILILVGLLSMQGYGTSNNVPALLAQIHNQYFTMTGEFAPAHKADTGDGWQLELRGGPRIGSSFYVQPGVAATYHHTSAYTKWLLSGRIQAGYSKYAYDAYGIFDTGLSANAARLSLGGGLLMHHIADTRMEGLVEFIVGPSNKGTREIQLRSMIGWGF